MRFRTTQLCRKAARWIPKGSSRFKVVHWIRRHIETHEPELANLDKLLPERRRRAIDAGAGYGHYSYRLSRYFDAVEAFEIDEDRTKDLAWLNRAIIVHHTGLSSSFAEATLFVPLSGGKNALPGWASLHPNNHPQFENHIEKRVKLAPLDKFEFSDVDFMKIDVEGHEVEVLDGARETIGRSHPRLLVEINERNLGEVRAFLLRLGYVEKDVSEQIGAATYSNFFFVFEGD